MRCLPKFFQCFLILVSLNATMIANETDPPTISVSGSAEIRVVPDFAVLRFSIESRELEVATSVTDNDAKVSAVVRYLTENKIESRSIRTELVRIQPVFESRSKQSYAAQQSIVAPALGSSAAERIKPMGYSASRQISVTINDLDAFETIYRGLIERGVNRVDNLDFQSTELRKHRDAARLQAVRAAREKATAMAGELGCSLAAVQSIGESNPGWRGSNRIQNVLIPDGDGPASAGSGTINISATVNVVFVLGKVELEQ